jgi:hypothetical protein
MLRIVLVIEDNSQVPPGIISKISRLSGKGLMEVKRAIAGHVPVLDKPLFDRLDSSPARDILSLLGDLEASNIPYKASELSGGDVYNERNTYFEITSTKLKNIINAREKSIEQQRVIGRLEDPE